ncbi:Holliday junction resolvase RuvX [Bacillus tropicus]|jgi:putative holliday junction resolvase|uniref:Holliday junction resolvase RuvX n=22 Tax=Bacillus cereus group TaxID=86661 RepID=A0AC61T5A0_9BACI|nr:MULTISPECIES: Holliday junction resolvase RuvX [Bacillus]AJI05112.1 putative Holliday junction resolvase [Bacillus cereus G9241]EEM20550.1 Holliday junction resolvase [Bacillus thuringiensis serovar tochigiensis BGSC 4Y1]MCU7391652.1 Holliday junction resolvase RuvX [Bacillus sp. ST24]MDL2417243.1 Holliday junction resolvase RuvX [Bacillus shihchuchen]MED4214353.1 Holliday junction resolvase RuvX [Priestia megaterium]NIE90674.1 Holliday junction resolvase RuvX [Bacillus sp. Ab-1751]OTX843
MRILGLDVGTKTVGVAISDEMGWTAQGLETIKINEERGHFGFDRISELVKQYNVDKIVVGLPKNMNGTIGPRGEACQQFAENLRELLQLDVVMWDERLSTMAAERLLISADVSRKKRKQVIDKMAAVVILQGFLDSK